MRCTTLPAADHSPSSADRYRAVSPPALASSPATIASTRMSCASWPCASVTKLNRMFSPMASSRFS